MVALACSCTCVLDVQQQWQWITPGAIIAVLATLLVSLGFSSYVSHFGSYTDISCEFSRENENCVTLVG